jgi:hypothetical protein
MESRAVSGPKPRYRDQCHGSFFHGLFLPNDEDERDGYLAQGMRQHDL